MQKALFQYSLINSTKINSTKINSTLQTSTKLDVKSNDIAICNPNALMPRFNGLKSEVLYSQQH